MSDTPKVDWNRRLHLMLGPERLTLTVPEAAKVLGIHVQTAYVWARRGDIPAIRLGGRLLVKRAELERMLDSDWSAGK